MTSIAFGATKAAKVNGTTLTYREEGEGEPVIFVHGAPSDLRTWEQQFARPNVDIDPEANDPKALRSLLVNLEDEGKPNGH